MNHILRHIGFTVRGDYLSSIFLINSSSMLWFEAIWSISLIIIRSRIVFPHTKRVIVIRARYVINDEEFEPPKPFGNSKPKNPFAKAQPWKDR